jgi:hypothetical protein
MIPCSLAEKIPFARRATLIPAFATLNSLQHIRHHLI